MEYFTELLKSYDKLKKRKLKLVESSDPHQLAQAALQQAQSQNPPPKLNNPFITQGAREQVAIFQTAKGWKFAPVNAAGNLGWMKPVEDPNFVGMFSPDEAGASTEPSTKGIDPGLTALGGDLGQENPEMMAEVAQDFIEMAGMIPDIIKGLDQKLYKKWGPKTVSMFGNYLFGMSPQALERQIVMKKTTVQRLNGEYIEAPIPVDPYTAKSVTKNLKKLLELISKQNKDLDNIKERNFIVNSFAIGNDGTVSIFSDTEDSGLVFNDNTGFLKLILGSAKSLFNLKLKNISYSNKHASVGEANGIRGTLFEEILPWISIVSKMKQVEKLGGDVNSLRDIAKESFNSLKEKLMKMASFQEGWALKFSQEALTNDEKDLLDELTIYAGKDSWKMIQSMIEISKNALKSRNPDFFIPVGLLTGGGERADVLECHSSYEKCYKALKSLGIQDDEIKNEGLILETTLEDLISSKVLDKSLAKKLTKSGIFQKGQKVFYTPTSLKNYITLDEVKLGTATISSHKNFFAGNNQKFLEEGMKTLNVDNIEDVKAYDSELDKIYHSVHKLGNISAKMLSGRTTKVKALSDLVRSSMGILRSNSSFEELFSNESALKKTTENELYNLLDRFSEEEKSSTSDKIPLEDKVKQYLSTYLKNKKLEMDFKAGKKDAAKYLALKLFNTAGCVKNGTLVDARALNVAKSYRFYQNKIIKSVIESMMTGKGEWSPEFKGNYVHFTNNRDPKAKVILSDKIQKRQKDYYSTSTMCNINETTMKLYNLTTMASAMESDLISSYLEQHRIILENMLSLKKSEFNLRES